MGFGRLWRSCLSFLGRMKSRVRFCPLGFVDFFFFGFGLIVGSWQGRGVWVGGKGDFLGFGGLGVWDGKVL